MVKHAAVIGGGPAGLMAAERIARSGAQVTIYERMPSLARKFLMAGRGGLNITHSEPVETFLTRYGAAAPRLARAIAAFPPMALRAWCAELGEATFVGSSGRVFPRRMKTSPLLRAWLRRLQAHGAQVRLRHEFRGWDTDGRVSFGLADGSSVLAQADAVVLAMGGASWPRLGSDGGWAPLLAARGIVIAPLRAANCGFEVAWSSHLRERFAGAPLKNVSLRACGETVRGECVVASHGLEGGAIYALSSRLRDAIEAAGPVTIFIDLKPDTPTDALARKLGAPRRKASLGNHLRKTCGLSPLAIAMLHETHAPFDSADALAAFIKALPVTLLRPRPIAEAISSAGGVALWELDETFMLKKMAGVFCAGEMIDWEAPTGGYLLQACLATGAAAGEGAARWLAQAPSITS